MLYSAEGDQRGVVAPDVCVVRGVPKLPMRRTYLLWEEGKPPTVVVEVTSRETRREDRVSKRALYERLAVQEYVLFDPLEEYLTPRLQGLTLGRAGYEPIEPNAAGRLPSAGLGLELYPRGHELALYDPAAERWLPTATEEVSARLQAEVARRAEEAARRAAEAEVARLRAELAVDGAPIEPRRRGEHPSLRQRPGRRGCHGFVGKPLVPSEVARIAGELLS